jgi:hypothetical protein
VSNFVSIRSFIRSTAVIALLGIAFTSTAVAQQPAPTTAAAAQPAAPSLTVAAQQPAAGQTTTTISPGHWTATPFVGFGFSGDLDSGTGLFGIAGGYVWNPRWSFEGEFTMLPSSENSGVIEAESTVWTLAANALYHFSGREWVPYGVAGIGFGHAGVDIDDPVLGNVLDETSNEFIANLGGGVERLIGNNVGFRGDVRYFFGGDLVPDYWRVTAGLTFGFRPR